MVEVMKYIEYNLKNIIINLVLLKLFEIFMIKAKLFVSLLK